MPICGKSLTADLTKTCYNHDYRAHGTPDMVVLSSAIGPEASIFVCRWSLSAVVFFHGNLTRGQHLLLQMVHAWAPREFVVLERLLGAQQAHHAGLGYHLASACDR